MSTTTAAFSCNDVTPIIHPLMAPDPTPISRVSYPTFKVRETEGSQLTRITPVEKHSDWLVTSFKRLAVLAKLKDDWDSHCAEAPNPESIELARDILTELALGDFLPSSIDPSAEGGICISFRTNNRYGDIECFNSGEILAVTSKAGDETDVWELPYLEKCLNDTVSKLRIFLCR